MNLHAVYMTIYIVLLWYGLRTIEHDRDFRIKLKRADKFLFIFLSVFPILWITSANTGSGLFAAFAFPYLQISALTDRKTKLVYISPTIILVILAVICECITFHRLSAFSLVLFLALSGMSYVGMFGFGDVPMSFVPGIAFFLRFPQNGFLNAMVFECIFMLFSQILFLIENYASGNMQTAFKLKEGQPLGPSLLIGSYISFGAYFALIN